MNRGIARLLLDGASLILLLLAFAYWWLGNTAHELIGTAFMIVLARHFLNNRTWWSSLRKGRYDLRRWTSVVLTFLLAATMAVLLGTSIAISRTTFAWLQLPGGFALREAHMFAAYWVVVLVGLHIGLNWQRVLQLARKFVGSRRIWRYAALAAVLVVAFQGYNSALVMDLWTRLRFEYSLVMWDFGTRALEFIGHWLAIVTLFAVFANASVRLHGWVPPRLREARGASSRNG